MNDQGSPQPDADVQRRAISEALQVWYAARRRDLPWRQSRDPYQIWVSEIMLQQTQVITVIPYYERFITQYPTVCALAQADLGEVLALWEGLGYYARARNLHRAAQIVCERYDGRLPDDEKTLLALPGIGEYSVGAILSIGFGQDIAAVDGNVVRVLCRLYDYAENPKTADGKRAMKEYASSLLPVGRAGDHNQAMMELGATICQPRAPQCGICPLSRFCRSYEAENQLSRPMRPAKRAVPTRHMLALLIEREGRLLIVRRPTEGLLGGLWELPSATIPDEASGAMEAIQSIGRQLDIHIALGQKLGLIQHAYTHFRVRVQVYAAKVDGEPQRVGSWTAAYWLAPDEREAYALTGVTNKILAKLPWSGSQQLL